MPNLLKSLTGDEATAALFTDSAELQGMLAFEVALAEVQAAVGVIPAVAAQEISSVAAGFAPDWQALQSAMARDGVAGPGFVAQLKAQVSEPNRKFVHFGATSQDVVDTSLVLRLRGLVGLIDVRLMGVIVALEQLRDTQGDVKLMAQTRMQQALEFTSADRVKSWLRPLDRDLARLHDILPNVLVVQFGGPVGDRRGLNGKGDETAAALAEKLGLYNGPCWHNARDGILEFAGVLALISGTLGKIGQDLALMAQNEVKAVTLPGGGASSAMAHKQNPVAAEVLVALARFNAGLLGTLHQSMVHENERSGAAWTLEWLILPQMAEATVAALVHALVLVSGLRFNGKS